MRRNLGAYYKMRDNIIASCKARRADLVKGNHLNDEVWAEAFGEGGFNLKDGYARVFALTKLDILHVFKEIRLEEEWLSPLLPDVAGFKEMTKWPRSNIAKSNPWRTPYFKRVVVAAPTFDKETGQYKVVFPPEAHKRQRLSPTQVMERHKAGKKGNQPAYEGVTYFFKGGVNKSDFLEGWLIPRQQKQGRPWQQGDRWFKAPPVRKVWVPELNEDEVDALIEGDKTWVIRSLHKKYADDLKEKRICIMDIKEAVDSLLESLEGKTE